MSVIQFSCDPYSALSNFSSHKVLFEGIEYATAEHAYQVAKFADPAMRQRIMHAPSAYLAHEWAQVKEGRTEDFELKKIKIMKAIMLVKLQQHADVREVLHLTGEALIQKNHPTDCFWGIGRMEVGRTGWERFGWSCEAGCDFGSRTCYNRGLSLQKNYDESRRSV